MRWRAPTGDDVPVHIPADRHVATRIRADLAEFKRKLAEANKQASTVPAAATVQSAHGQPRSLGPPSRVRAGPNIWDRANILDDGQNQF
jgi:hypothetical protein